MVEKKQKKLKKVAMNQKRAEKTVGKKVVNPEEGKKVKLEVKTKKKSRSIVPVVLMVMVFLLSALAIILAMMIKNKLFMARPLLVHQATEDRFNSVDITGDINQQMETVLSLFADNQSVIALIDGVASAKSGFDNLTLSFDSDQVLMDQKQKYLPVVLEIEGSSDKVHQFIRQLTDGNYLFQVDKIHGQTTDSFVNKAQLTIEAKLYLSDSFK